MHAPSASLGPNTKSASAPVFGDRISHETGEVTADWSPAAKWRLLDTARDLLPGERIGFCHHVLSHDRDDKGGGVEIRRHESGTHSVAGVAACGNVWACPVCAPRIQNGRASELRAAIDAHVQNGGNVVMVTQTVPHHWDALTDLLPAFKAAQRRFKSGRGWQRIVTDYGVLGSVQALEVTLGANGWHVHAHTILFVAAGCHRVQLRHDLAGMWQSAVVASGLERPSDAHGLDVQDASAVHDYLTKSGHSYQWNSEHELAKATSKRGRGSSTPFDLLRAAMTGDRTAAGRFVEYYAVFKGRRQLVWSRGLRDALIPDYEERTDAELATAGDDTETVFTFTPAQWTVVCRLRLIGTVLEIANWHSADALASIRDYCQRVAKPATPAAPRMAA